MQINEAMAQQLEMYGFKWAYEDSDETDSTDTVSPNDIKRVVPTKLGFVIVYNDSCKLVCSACDVKTIEWRDSPLTDWVFVYYENLRDIDA